MLRKRHFWRKVRFPSFCVRIALLITIIRNPLPKGHFWCRVCFPKLTAKTIFLVQSAYSITICDKIALVITVTRTLLSKRHFLFKVRFLKIRVKTALLSTVSRIFSQNVNFVLMSSFSDKIPLVITVT